MGAQGYQKEENMTIRILKRIFPLITLILLVMGVGCSKGPVAGTWEGTLKLAKVFEDTITSPLRLEIKGKDFLSGTFSAPEFGWNNIPIDDKRSVYVPDVKGIAIVVPVGGDDGELILTGQVEGNSIKNGEASTPALRAGIWTATRK
jgi:hypothetical protein